MGLLLTEETLQYMEPPLANHIQWRKMRTQAEIIQIKKNIYQCNKKMHSYLILKACIPFKNKELTFLHP